MFQYNRKSFETQLDEDHTVSILKTYLQEVVYGGNDGIISTFVVVSGFTGAMGSEGFSSGLSLATLMLFGFANLIADAVSMAMGNFLSIRADKDVYRDLASLEMKRLHAEKGKELAETEYILTEKGFTTAQARKMAEIMSQNRPYWLSFMMGSELGLDNILDENPVITALVTFISFICFGFIPLFPFVFFGSSDNTFLISAISTGFALVVLGILRAFITRQSPFKKIFETLFVGALASGVAYFVGTLF